MPAKSLFYVYCVTGAETSAVPPEIGGNVSLIRQNGVCAVTGVVSPEEFAEEKIKERIADAGWLESNVLLHERVIEAVMKTVPAVVPFKFATVFKTARSIKTMLKDRSDDLSNTLQRLAGKEEWGVKVYCIPDGLRELIEGEHEIKSVEEEIDSSSAGRAYFLRKKRERLMEDALGLRIVECTREAFGRLSRVSRDARIGRLLPREATGREDEMVLNASFLVERAGLGGFHRCADRLKEKWSASGFNLEGTGPWPPYNFCTAGAAAVDKG